MAKAKKAAKPKTEKKPRKVRGAKPNPTRAETLAASRDKNAQSAESDKFH